MCVLSCSSNRWSDSVTGSGREMLNFVIVLLDYVEKEEEGSHSGTLERRGLCEGIWTDQAREHYHE